MSLRRPPWNFGLPVALAVRYFMGVSLGSGEEYRRFAVECWLAAQKLDDPSRKADLLSMAASWRRLAEFVDSQAPQNAERSSENHK
jgi:hypothetical protein